MTDKALRHPRLSRSYWNLRFFGLPQPVRDLVLFALCVIVAFTLAGQQSTIDRQREGRRVAIQVLCGAEQGVIDAGRQQLLKYGQQGAAADYARTVARAIEREARITGLLDVAIGHLRCDRLVRASGAK